MKEQPAIFGYSERGVINSIVYYTLCKPNLAAKFIEILLPNVKFDVKDDISFYVEQSLSDFGDPDLMIKIGDSLIFVEAKVRTCSNNWKDLKSELEKYKNSDYPKSNLFRQLGLKYYLVNNLSDASNGIKIDNEKIQGRKLQRRKIGKNQVVLKAFKEIKENLKHCYYVAVVPDSHDDVDTFEKSNKYKTVKFLFPIKFVSWEDIKKELATDEYPLIKATFEYNEGQILKSGS